MELTTPSTTRTFLQKALLGNALFSATSGLLLVVFPTAVAAFIGDFQPIYITLIGIVLLLYAPILYWAATRDQINRLLAWVFIDLDILWVVGSIVLIFTDLLPLTTNGKWAIAIVADIVALFAIAQYIGLRKEPA